MNRIYQLSIFLLSITGFISCSKQLDINDDPNNFTNGPVKLLVPSQQVQLTYTLGGEAGRIIGSVSQHFAGHRNQPLEYATYDVRPFTSDGMWSSFYSYVLRDQKAIIDQARTSGDSMYVGLGQIMMAQTFSYLTDFYGDIPFSEALQDASNLTPKYDKQENIYPALIKMIEAGIANVKSGKGLQPGQEDLVYGLETTNWASRWEKYGNSLKLRLLNHESKRNPTAAATFLATNPSLISSNAENAKVTYGSTSANANPIYGFDKLSGRKDMALSSTFVDKLKAGLGDPRLSVLAEPIVNSGGNGQGQYFGNIPGSKIDDSGEKLYSREGTAYASINSPVMLMSYAEVQFIIAEVKLRAADPAGAKTAYEAAITADFSSLGVPLGTYLTLSAPFNSTLQRIIEQKWITMIQAPYEAWIDWRRTGFPALTPAINNKTGGVIPRRLTYAQLEINLNAAQLAAGPGMPVPYESLKQRVWWDVQ